MSNAILARQAPYSQDREQLHGVKPTAIAWTDSTVNFWIGCQKVSPGCANCYAERIVRDRMGRRHWGSSPRWRTKGAWGNAIKYNDIARRYGKRIMVFANDMSDWAEDHPDVNEWRSDMWNTIRKCDWIDWQLLTKRADRIKGCLPTDWESGYKNVWLGVSIETDGLCSRADHLRKIPAAVRFVSYEPALEPIPSLNLDGIDWLIVGGESGPGFREFDHEWAVDLENRCKESGTAFFFKQSAAYRTELGIELHGNVIRNFPDANTR